MTRKPYPTMSPTRYLQAIGKLGLSNYAAAPILGVSLRQAQRYVGGNSPVPETVAKLLAMLQRHGIPEEFR